MRAGAGAPSDAPPALRVATWLDIPGLTHGFFGRGGGVSGGDLAALNVSEQVGDDVDAVTENWHRIAAHCGGLEWVRMRQVHGARVVCVEATDRPIDEADGLIARRAGLGLTVLTADCVPILCVAPRRRAVMALHAGWRGTLAGIAAVGLAEARHWLGIEPSAWQVAMGPSIGGCCYEVETRIGERLVDRWGPMPEAWRPHGSHGRLDLRAANRSILLAQGVVEPQISMVGPCTSCQSSEYFSHRRSGGRAGRQLSVIGWVA